MPVLAGLSGIQAGRASSYPPAAGERALGNALPPNTGVWLPDPFRPGPTGVGQSPAASQLGSEDGSWGADPRAAKVINPVFLPAKPNWAEPGQMDSGMRGTPTWWRNGIIGFNDQLRVVDRHAFWDTGQQKTGLTFAPEAAPPNAWNDPRVHPPVPELRTVNRSVTYQKGADNTINQDDLGRPYTRNPQGMYVGEQGSGWSPVYGGTPGLYQPYGSRGGVPYPIVAPVAYMAAGDGPQKVFSGPPHGLHSLTYPDRAETLSRYTAFPQQRPVRFDRPSNSPQAGQSYSQTVVPQGGKTGTLRQSAPASSWLPHRGRGWRGSAG